jgi:hypothetical protein
MSIFNKIIDLKEYLFTPEKEEELRNLIKESTKHIFPRPNDDVEFIVPLFNTQKHYKHLKKQIWKFSHK